MDRSNRNMKKLLDRYVYWMRSVVVGSIADGFPTTKNDYLYTAFFTAIPLIILLGFVTLITCY